MGKELEERQNKITIYANITGTSVFISNDYYEKDRFRALPCF